MMLPQLFLWWERVSFNNLVNGYPAFGAPSVMISLFYALPKNSMLYCFYPQSALTLTLGARSPSNPPSLTNAKEKLRKHLDDASSVISMVGEGGFEPPKSLTTDLQSAPFGHSGTLPYSIDCYTLIKKVELVDGLEPPTC